MYNGVYIHVEADNCIFFPTEKVTGKPMSLSGDATLSKLHKASIVAQTKISYSQKELLQLIHSHLLSQGEFIVLFYTPNLQVSRQLGQKYVRIKLR